MSKILQKANHVHIFFFCVHDWCLFWKFIARVSWKLQHWNGCVNQLMDCNPRSNIEEWNRNIFPYLISVYFIRFYVWIIRLSWPWPGAAINYLMMNHVICSVGTKLPETSAMAMTVCVMTFSGLHPAIWNSLSPEKCRRTLMMIQYKFR